jgi:hypothetical protein
MRARADRRSAAHVNRCRGPSNSDSPISASRRNARIPNPCPDRTPRDAARQPKWRQLSAPQRYLGKRMCVARSRTLGHRPPSPQAGACAPPRALARRSRHALPCPHRTPRRRSIATERRYGSSRSRVVRVILLPHLVAEPVRHVASDAEQPSADGWEPAPAPRSRPVCPDLDRPRQRIERLRSGRARHGVQTQEGRLPNGERAMRVVRPGIGENPSGPLGPGRHQGRV